MFTSQNAAGGLTAVRIGRYLPALLWFAASCLMSGSTALAQKESGTTYRIDGAEVDVPFDYVQHQILVRAFAGSSDRLTFLVDTGAAASVVDSGSAITGEALAKTTFEEAEGDAPAEIEQIVDLRLGDTGRSAEMRNPAVLSTDLSQISRLLHRKIDGIIGIPYLAGFVTEIDYDRKLLIFHDPRHFNLTNRTPQAGRSYLIKLGVLSANNPVSKVTITGGLPGGQNLSFLLDTGFGGYVLVPHDAAIQSGLLTGDTPAIATVDYSLSHQFRSQKIVAQGLSIGQIDLSGKVVQVDYRSREADGALGIIGNRLLQNYHVVLDYPHKLLWLERTNTAEEPDDAARPSLGIILDDHSSDVRVESVSENSPARRAGIRPGDTILSINGISTSDMTVDKAASLLRQLSGLVHMELRRGVDPNLGIRGGLLFLSLRPTSPFQWLSQ